MINMIGSLQSYMKNMKLEHTWQERKKNGYYEKIAETDPQKASYLQKLDLMRENSDSGDLETIVLKMKSGKKLTPSELKYLEEKSPETYSKAKQIEAERAGYEKKLKNCKTKEDVQKLKMLHTSAALTTVKSVANNSHIPDNKKLEIMEFVNMKMKAISDAEKKFVESGNYSRLITEAEKNQADHDENELEKIELTKPKVEEENLDAEVDKKPEIALPDGKAEDAVEIEKAEVKKAEIEVRESSRAHRAYREASATVQDAEKEKVYRGRYHKKA